MNGDDTTFVQEADKYTPSTVPVDSQLTHQMAQLAAQQRTAQLAAQQQQQLIAQQQRLAAQQAAREAAQQATIQRAEAEAKRAQLEDADVDALIQSNSVTMNALDNMLHVGDEELGDIQSEMSEFTTSIGL